MSGKEDWEPEDMVDCYDYESEISISKKVLIDFMKGAAIGALEIGGMMIIKALSDKVRKY